MALPDFDANGNLPAGVHSCTWEEFRQRFVTDRHRRELARGLRDALQLLRVAGVEDVWLAGSYVTEKAFPNDWDGCFGLRGLDPTKIDPIFFDLADLGAGRPKQHARFGGEFLLATAPGGAGKSMLDFFQLDRDDNPKGIVKLDMNSL